MRQLARLLQGFPHGEPVDIVLQELSIPQLHVEKVWIPGRFHGRGRQMSPAMHGRSRVGQQLGGLGEAGH